MPAVAPRLDSRDKVGSAALVRARWLAAGVGDDCGSVALVGADAPGLLGPAHSLPAGGAQSLLVGGLVVIGLGTLVMRFSVATVKTLVRICARSS